MTLAETKDSHLLNSIRMLERKCGALKLKLGLDKSTEEVAKAVFPVYGQMVKEMNFRLAAAKKCGPRMITRQVICEE